MATLRNRTRGHPPAGPQLTPVDEGFGEEWDDTFAYIAGFSPGGATFGVTWKRPAGSTMSTELRLTQTVFPAIP